MQSSFHLLDALIVEGGEANEFSELNESLTVHLADLLIQIKVCHVLCVLVLWVLTKLQCVTKELHLVRKGLQVETEFDSHYLGQLTVLEQISSH